MSQVPGYARAYEAGMRAAEARNGPPPSPKWEQLSTTPPPGSGQSIGWIDQAHQLVDLLAKILELAGVAIILGGIVLATVTYVREGRASGWRIAYDRYRSNLGRGILLGLELLVGADIIATITAPLTLLSVSLLGLVIIIRTFLSFSLETEIEGVWPWQRAKSEADGSAKEQR